MKDLELKKKQQVTSSQRNRIESYFAILQICSKSVHRPLWYGRKPTCYYSSTLRWPLNKTTITEIIMLFPRCSFTILTIFTPDYCLTLQRSRVAVKPRGLATSWVNFWFCLVNFLLKIGNWCLSAINKLELVLVEVVLWIQELDWCFQKLQRLWWYIFYMYRFFLLWNIERGISSVKFFWDFGDCHSFFFFLYLSFNFHCQILNADFVFEMLYFWLENERGNGFIL